ncbi:ORF20 [Felid gammaherpesvirus 1]|uniref:ORF20 n=1 Tax=Felid gammaherpesvirus 1 TaxID=2560468 RepID=A0A0M5KXP1_9GAMA|nr:ORF20 [Felis catus gammaherpesvirus 1]ALE14731.1 ORF20 [Felis catus gammaherpesvirus 1]
MTVLPEQISKDILSVLPASRKAAGKKAHLKIYKKLLGYRNTNSLLKFLSITHPCPNKCTFKLFIEVSLGNRISDCVLLLTCGESRICYVIELKTCISKQTNMSRDIRQAQKSQGLHQLLDAVRFVQNSLPLGRQKWNLIPHLLFKCQNSLKTIYQESPAFMTNLAFSNHQKLSQFFTQREDLGLKKRLSSHLHVLKHKTTQSLCDKNPGTKQSITHKQRLIDRNKKVCFKIQKARLGATPFSGKKRPIEGRIGSFSTRSYQYNPRRAPKTRYPRKCYSASFS